MFLTLQKQKRSHDQVDCDEDEVYAIVKKPRVEERKEKGTKGSITAILIPFMPKLGENVRLNRS